MENTTNLKLPLLISNQSQKEITHNEALVILDNIVQNGIIDKDLTAPPENPNSNDLYIVGNNAVSIWEGKDQQLAFYDNGWRFIQPKNGFIFWINDENKLYVYSVNKWTEAIIRGSGGGSENATYLTDLLDVEINSPSKYDILQYNGSEFTNKNEIQNINLLGINATADNENKLTVKSDYVLFDNRENDSKIKVNKSSTENTASHLFQANYVGKAEFGLIGNDNFTLKVSNTQNEWKESFMVDQNTGNVDFKGNISNNGLNLVGNICLPIPQNTDNTKVGYFFLLETTYGQITLPSQGTWMVWGEARSGTGVKLCQWGGIYNAGAIVGSIGNYNDGFAMKIK